MSNPDLFTALEDLVKRAVREVVREEMRAAPQSDEYLSLAKAAKIADGNAATLRRWIKAGKLKGYGFGRELRVKRADLEALLNGECRKCGGLIGAGRDGERCSCMFEEDSIESLARRIAKPSAPRR